MRTPEETEALLDRLESLLGQFDEANDRFDRDQWNQKYGEKLSPYSDRLKQLNGDDFDIMKESYDEYHDKYSDFESDKYIDALTGNIKKVIERIWPEAPEEVKEEAAEQISEAVDEGGEGKVETHIEAEDKDGDGEITGGEVETHTVEEKDEGGTEGGEEGTEEKEDEGGKDDEMTSDSNAKTRYQKRSDSNKKKLTGWDPQKGLLRSDEDCKEPPKEEENDDPVASFKKDLEADFSKYHR